MKFISCNLKTGRHDKSPFVPISLLVFAHSILTFHFFFKYLNTVLFYWGEVYTSLPFSCIYLFLLYFAILSIFYYNSPMKSLSSINSFFHFQHSHISLWILEKWQLLFSLQIHPHSSMVTCIASAFLSTSESSTFQYNFMCTLIFIDTTYVSTQ